MGLLGLGVVVAVAAGVAWWWMGQPTYRPGAVAERDDLDPVGTQLAEALEVAPGITLHSFVEGEGPLALVVHGGPGVPPEAPWPALTRLVERRSFLYYHQRGSGRSTRPVDVPEGRGYGEKLAAVERTLGIGQQLADIERIRRLAGVGDLVVVGHSYGAFLAALYAAEFPDAVSELVLLAPAALLRLPDPDGADLFDTIRARLPEGDRPEFDAFLSRYLDFSPTLCTRTDGELAALNQELGAWYGRVVPDLHAVPAGEAGGWMVFAGYFSMGRRHDYTDALSAIRARTLIVHGDRDLQPRAVSERYQRAIEGAELVTIEGAGHFPHVSHADALSEVLGAWLRAGGAP